MMNFDLQSTQIILHAMESSQEAVEKILDEFPFIVALCDEEGRLIKANRDCQKLLNKKEEDILGEPFSILIPAINSWEFEKFITSMGKNSRDKDDYLINIASYSTKQTVLWKLKYLSSCGLVLMIGTDTTEIENLKKVEIGHVQKVNTISSFVGGIAHELNNPLTILLGLINMIEDGEPDDPSFKKKLEKLLETGKRISRVIKDVREYGSHFDLKKIDYVLVDKILKDEIEKKKGQPKNIKYEYELNFKHTKSEILINLKDLFTLIHLLLNNAQRSYSIEVKQKKIKVITSNPNSEHLQIEFRDYGAKIPKYLEKDIFNPFVSERRDEGDFVGLGLSSAYAITSNYNGHIYLESEKKIGSNFILLFPLSGRENTNEPYNG